ncbi:MAG: BatD family protein, partial [Sulfurovum sp.]|nr:BatD family protein [Sulfurovum sp.]
MQNLGKIIGILVLSLGWVYATSVRATVDTIEVIKGNAVTLRIEAKGNAIVFPKIVKIGDAQIRGTSSSSSQNWSLVNGSMSNESGTTKTIQFVPSKSMTIPSYTVSIAGKPYQTDPIEIKVVKSNSTSSQANALFSLTLKSSKEQVYVGESFMITAYFSLRSDIGASPQVKYTPPTLPDFLVVDAGEQPAYIKGKYQIQEVRYIVTAQQEGNFSVNPASAKVGVADRNSRDPFARMFSRLKWYQTLSNALAIEVLPQAVESDLIGDFNIEAQIDAQEVKANKPVNLTVKIEGHGNLEGVEFPQYEIDGVTIYSDEAKIDTKVVNGTLYSIYTKSFAFISEEDFTIPKRTFS